MNVDAVTGGAAATDWIDERREARRRARDDHALVSSDRHRVGGARICRCSKSHAPGCCTPDDKAPRTGTVTLVAMRARVSEEEAGSTPETPRWLEAIRRRLVAKMPLATRLVVVGASIRRVLDPRERSKSLPAAIRQRSRPRSSASSRQRLALVGTAARHPGVPVTTRDLTAWIRVVEGVRRVTALRLVLASGSESDEIKVPRNGLPRVDLAGSTIDVKRAGSGACAMTRASAARLSLQHAGAVEHVSVRSGRSRRLRCRWRRSADRAVRADRAALRNARARMRRRSRALAKFCGTTMRAACIDLRRADDEPEVDAAPYAIAQRIATRVDIERAVGRRRIR